MERRFFKVRGCIAALLAILLSLCLALGLAFAVPSAVYADEGDGEGSTETGGEELPEGGEETEKQENEWVVEPAFVVVVGEDEVVIDEWTQGTFHGDEYVINAEARHGSDEMYFRIYKDGKDGLAPVAFGKGIAIHGETDKEAFKTAADGRVPAYVAEKINELEVGVYYLLAIVPEDIYGEYAGLNYMLSDEEIKENSFVFEVTAAPEVVDVTLSGLKITEWTLGDFDVEKNLIKVETNASADEVSYTVYRDNDGVKGLAVINLTEFNIMANGMVADRVTMEAFNLLGAGKYYLTASVTNAEGEVLTETVSFNIRIQNYWVVVPSLTNWTEGQFSIKENVLRGVSKVGHATFTIYDDKDNLLYTVVKNEDGTIDSVTDADGNGDLHIKALNKLGVGSYKIVAEVESTDRYSELKTIAYFSVQEDSVALGGIIAATVVFAVADLIAAGLCIALLIIRRRKVEAQFHKMVNRELHRG